MNLVTTRARYVRLQDYNFLPVKGLGLCTLTTMDDLSRFLVVLVLPLGVVVLTLGQTGCGPPDFPSYEVNSTEDHLNQLTLQGRCYTICIGDDLIEDYESV